MRRVKGRETETTSLIKSRFPTLEERNGLELWLNTGICRLFHCLSATLHFANKKSAIVEAVEFRESIPFVPGALDRAFKIKGRRIAEQVKQSAERLGLLSGTAASPGRRLILSQGRLKQRLRGRPPRRPRWRGSTPA
jgi:hypothetical protein